MNNTLKIIFVTLVVGITGVVIDRIVAHFIGEAKWWLICTACVPVFFLISLVKIRKDKKERPWEYR